MPKDGIILRNRKLIVVKKNNTANLQKLFKLIIRYNLQ